MMRTGGILAVVVCLAVAGCGGGSSGANQELLADLMVEQDDFGFMDEECVREKTAELSDEDAQILIDNIDADDVEGLGLSEEAEAWVFTLLACIGDDVDFTEDDSPTTLIEGAPEGVTGDRSAPVPAGEVADVDRGWRVQVLDVTEDGTEILMAQEFNGPPPDGSRYTVVEVAVGYYGNEWGTPPFISAVGAASVELDSYCGFVPDELESFGIVFGGGVMTGNLCWVTTADDAGKMLLYTSAGYSGDDVFLEVAAPASAPDVMPSMSGPQPGTDDAEARNNPIPVATPTDLGEGWQITIAGPARDITDELLAASEYNDPPPDGYRFIGFDVSLEFSDEDRSASGFEVDIDVVGDSNIALEEECGEISDPLDLFTDVFSGAALTSSLCFVAPVDDVGTLVAFSSTSFGDSSFLAIEE